MPMAYVSFCKPVNADTMTSLVQQVRNTLWDSDKKSPANGIAFES